MITHSYWVDRGRSRQTLFRACYDCGHLELFHFMHRMTRPGRRTSIRACFICRWCEDLNARRLPE